MTRMPSIGYEKVIRALQRDGWVVVRQRGQLHRGWKAAPTKRKSAHGSRNPEAAASGFLIWLTFSSRIFSIFSKHSKQSECAMKTETVSARLSPETAKKFALLAKAINRSKSYLAAEAIENYVNDQQWQIDAIVKGIKEADEGKFVTDRKLRDTLSKWGIDED